MTNHPLTDEICLAIDDNSMIDEDDWKGYMRAGADWQLEQAIDWLKDNVSHSLWLEVTDKGVTYPNRSKNDKRLLRLDLDWIVDDLREAIRPTNTQEEN